MTPIILLIVVAAGVATLALRWFKQPEPPSVVPKPAPPKAPETENDRLIRALTTMDQRAAERMDRLKWFLFWLPFVWGIIYGVVWIIIIQMR